MKEDNITLDHKEERDKAQRVLETGKQKHAKMKFVKVPIMNGYKLIEKRKYERMKMRGGREIV